MRLLRSGLILVVLSAGLEASAQTTFGVDIVVSEEATAEGHVYRYRVKNAGSAPSGQFMLGYDQDQGDAFLTAAPTTIRSPEGWKGTIEGGEGLSGFAIYWQTIARRDRANSIPPHGGLKGFEVVLSRPDPTYRTTRATVTFWDGNQDVATVMPGIPSSDFIKPTVVLAAPTAGSGVSGTVRVSAEASDDVGVLDVRLQVDGRDIVALSHPGIAQPPYGVAWNTLLEANGAHVLTAIARDAAGNTSVSAPVSVTVTNDVTPPTVSLTSPPAGAILTGTVTLIASAQAATSVLGVLFLVDGTALGTWVAKPPFSRSWDTSTVPNGNHELRATVMDAGGRVRASSVSVTVRN